MANPGLVKISLTEWNDSLACPGDPRPGWIVVYRFCHQLRAVSHHWGPTQIADQSKALPRTAGRIPISHHCQDLPGISNHDCCMWENSKWLSVKWWFSLITTISSTIPNWLIIIQPLFGRKRDKKNSKFQAWKGHIILVIMRLVKNCENLSKWRAPQTPAPIRQFYNSNPHILLPEEGGGGVLKL